MGTLIKRHHHHRMPLCARKHTAPKGHKKLLFEIGFEDRERVLTRAEHTLDAVCLFHTPARLITDRRLSVLLANPIKVSRVETSV